MHKPILNAWKVSPYSAKTRAHLRFLGVDFQERVPSMPRLAGPIRKAVGQAIMPTIQLPNGGWLQDSSAIYDHFEASSSFKTLPTQPRHRLAAFILEVQADEWLCLAALHYRWSRPENVDFALTEFARDGFPVLPRRLGKFAAKKVADRMRGYLPMLGVTPATTSALETHTLAVLSALNTHLASRPFIFGTRASLADFSLYGPLYAHLFRDPATTSLFDPFPNVATWIARLGAPPKDTGSFEDDWPDTLDTLIDLCGDQWAYLETLMTAVEDYVDSHLEASRVPRALGMTTFQMGSATAERKLITFAQWKAQRAMNSCDPNDTELIEWLDARQLATVYRPLRHRLERPDFKMILKRGAS
ncbi:MAG: glutathione S-transferase [Myxococcota bacterium]|jgi:glutathione S-transferase